MAGNIESYKPGNWERLENSRVPVIFKPEKRSFVPENIIWERKNLHTGEKVREEDKINDKLGNLGLTREELIGKRILDMGCGRRGDFHNSLIKEGITQEAYGADLEVVEGQMGKNSHFFKIDFTKDPELPVKDLDFITFHGALPLPIEERGPDKIAHAIKISFNALKDKGQIRISHAEYQDNLSRILNGLPSELPATDIFDYKFIKSKGEKKGSDSSSNLLMIRKVKIPKHHYQA